MNYFLDDTNFYNYLCLNDINLSEIQGLVKELENNNVQSTKVYTEPKYPASNGNKYQYLIRITNTNKDITALRIAVDKTINLFKSKESSNKNQVDYLLKDAIDIVNIAKENRKDKELSNRLLENKFSNVLDDLNILKSSLYNLTEENKNLRLLVQSANKEMLALLKKTINKENISFDSANKIKALENQLKLERKELQEFEKSILAKEEELLAREEQLENKELSIQEAVESVRNTDFGLTARDEDPISKVKILVFGDFKLSKSVITTYIEKTFHELGLIEFTSKNIEFGPLKYNEVKNSGIYKKIQSNRYDLIISGPHPHSNKDGNLNSTIDSYAIKRKLKAFIYSDYKNIINANRITEAILNFSKDFKYQNNIDE